MKFPSLTDDARKLARKAARLGAALALLCHVLPPEYRAVCEAIADVCRGGL